MRRIPIVLALTLIASAFAFGQQVLKPGEPAPVFSGQALDGTVYDLNELNGKVVVLTFWNTRCAVCHSEIPHLNRVAERYRGKDVVFLAVTMDSETRINPYIRKNPFNFAIVPNGFGVMLKYADRDRWGNLNMGFPAHFLISQNGTIASRTDGWDKASNLDWQISRLLGD